jgi:hypothetical protein
MTEDNELLAGIVDEGEEGTRPEDRRRYERHDVKILVRLTSGDREFELQSENVSLGGMFLLTEAEAPPINDLVDVQMVLPEGPGGRPRKIPVRAAVLYVVEGKGFGLEFQWWTDEETENRELLEDHFTDLGFSTTSADDPLGAVSTEFIDKSQEGEPVSD